MSKPILCVDFDGVIHSYASGWKGADIIPDPPVPGALKWLWKATEWWDVQVYSSRSKEPAGRLAMLTWMATYSRQEFGDTHPMALLDEALYPITFAHEKPAAFLTIDDRAICFDGDWSELDAYDLTKFKPWNKRPPVPAFGATNSFPDGKLNEHDEGELRMGVARAPDGMVHLNFGKPVAWLALPPNEAKHFAALLMKHAAGATIGCSPRKHTL